MEICERRNSPNFKKPIHWEKRTDWDFRCSRQGLMAWAVTEIRCAVGSARPRWCHGGWDPRRLRSGGEETRSRSRDGLLNWSPDGWFSCSKTSDSAEQAITWFSIFGDYIYIFSISRWIVEVKKQIEIRVFLDHWMCWKNLFWSLDPFDL